MAHNGKFFSFESTDYQFSRKELKAVIAGYVWLSFADLHVYDDRKGRAISPSFEAPLELLVIYSRLFWLFHDEICELRRFLEVCPRNYSFLFCKQGGEKS